MAEKRDWSFLQLIALGVVLEVIFKQFPVLNAVQPILPIAIVAGILYGTERGFAVGLFSALVAGVLLYSASYFGAGIFFVEVIACALAGAIGGMVAKSRKPSKTEFVGLCVIAAIAFEALNNFFQGTQFARLSGFYYLEGTMLASALHIVFAVVLAMLLAGLLENK